jgi:hypothetical protein
VLPHIQSFVIHGLYGNADRYGWVGGFQGVSLAGLLLQSIRQARLLQRAESLSSLFTTISPKYIVVTRRKSCPYQKHKNKRSIHAFFAVMFDARREFTSRQVTRKSSK